MLLLYFPNFIHCMYFSGGRCEEVTDGLGQDYLVIPKFPGYTDINKQPDFHLILNDIYWAHMKHCAKYLSGP